MFQCRRRAHCSGENIFSLRKKKFNINLLMGLFVFKQKKQPPSRRDCIQICLRLKTIIFCTHSIASFQTISIDLSPAFNSFGEISHKPHFLGNIKYFLKDKSTFATKALQYSDILYLRRISFDRAVSCRQSIYIYDFPLASRPSIQTIPILQIISCCARIERQPMRFIWSTRFFGKTIICVKWNFTAV